MRPAPRLASACIQLTSAHSYAQFQISDGVGGNAQAEANAVFVDPFAGTDLASVSSDVLDAMNSMREAAEEEPDDERSPVARVACG